MLPARYKSGLQLVTSAPYTPFEVYGPGKTLTGLDIDMGNAIAATLGTKATWTSVPFEGVVGGLAAHKYDFGLADYGATDARLRALDFVTYFQQGDALIVPKGNPGHIQGMQSMCGKKLLVEAGVSPESFVSPTQKLCADSGKPAVSVTFLPSQASLLLGLQSKQGDATILTYPAAKALESSSQRSEVSMVPLPPSMPGGIVPKYIGVALAKNQTPLRDAVAAALRSMLAHGTITQIFRKYGLQELVTPTIHVNEVLSPSPAFPSDATAG